MAYFLRPSSVVCHRELCKTAEPMEMSFGMSTRVQVQGNVYYDGVHVGATWGIRLSRPCAAAVRPFCQITLTTCYFFFYLLPSRILDPLRFQAGGRRRRLNLGLVCFLLMFAVFLVKDA